MTKWIKIKEEELRLLVKYAKEGLKREIISEVKSNDIITLAHNIRVQEYKLYK